MNIYIAVWITLPNNDTVRLGDLAFSDVARADGTSPTAFRYSSDWLRHREAFPINPDPQTLPLVTGEFHASHLGHPLGVFDDALPDDWGRRLIIREHRLPMAQQTPYGIMRAVGGATLGALSFSEGGTPPPRPSATFELRDLLESALAFDAGQTLDDPRLHRLYAAGATPGGARPKALVQTPDGTPWIAKFPSLNRDNGFDVVGLEAVSLTLGREAGLQVPDSQLVSLGARKALLVRRFDVAAGGGRVHKVSLHTLCREGAGRYCQSYNEPAMVIRRFSAEPDTDVLRFFRQMVFNGAIGNTDDHLKNFLMVNDGHGYRLSPAFDLVPDVGRNINHQMAFGYDFGPPSWDQLLQVGRHWLTNPADAGHVIQEVIDAVSNFPERAAALDVDRQSIDRIWSDIDGRLSRLRPQRIHGQQAPVSADSRPCVAADLECGRYTGPIVAVDGEYALQDVGRTIVSHCLDRFPTPPRVGDRWRLQYIDGAVTATPMERGSSNQHLGRSGRR